MYKNDLEEGPWIRLFENGAVNYKGNFKNGKKVGPWEYYYPNGYQYEEHSGIYKNGKKVSSKT
ncbi:hypothetical protein N9372_03845 [Alphaproteobacteria bacterium]|nr:hypothetical protein [Alphaproteobacteria bacterium]